MKLTEPQSATIRQPLYVHAAMYGFNPCSPVDNRPVSRKQILQTIERLWQQHGLEARTRFNARIEEIIRVGDKLILDHPRNGRFDGVIVAIGTCGDQSVPRLENIHNFKSSVLHHSELPM